MRNLDELLQDIPLEDLMGKTTKEIDPVPAKKDPAKPAVKIKSGWPAIVVTAAVILLAVGAVAFSVGRSGITASTKQFPEAEPIVSQPAKDASSRNMKHEIEMLPSLHGIREELGAEIIFKAMEQYSAAHPEEGTKLKNCELYMPLDGSKETYTTDELRMISGYNLDGYAFFVFGTEGKLLLAEWTQEEYGIGAGSYYVGKDGTGIGGTVGSLGEYPYSADFSSELSFYIQYGNVRIDYTYENNTERSFTIPRSEMRNEISAFAKRRPIDKYTPPSSGTDSVPEKKSRVSITFMWFGEEITVSEPDNPEADFSYNGKDYISTQGDEDYFAKARELIVEKLIHSP